MAKPNKKKEQREFAKKAINKYFSLLETRFYPKFDSKYIDEIKKFSTSFNLRLSREQKQKFCRNCKTYFTTKTLQIRFNSKNKTKDYICLNCQKVKRFRYN